jgi:uncharacterized oxidoreductase
MKLHNRTVLITGGTSGIGLELAKRLLDLGNTVIVTGRDASRLEQARVALPGLHTFQSDVSDAAAIQALYNRVIAQFPALDVLINNAGIMRNLDLNQTRELADATREIDINLGGPIQMIQQFLAHLKTRPMAAIINVSSGLAFIPLPLSPVYCATKAAMHSFSRSLRVQLAGTNVAVIELAPPGVETPLFRNEFEKELKNEKAMPVETLGRLAIAGIEAGKLEIRPGQSNLLKVMSRIAPELVFRQLSKLGKSV